MRAASKIMSTQATGIVKAFEQGRKAARNRKGIGATPYKDRERAESWERGYKWEKERNENR